MIELKKSVMNWLSTWNWTHSIDLDWRICEKDNYVVDLEIFNINTLKTTTIRFYMNTVLSNWDRAQKLNEFTNQIRKEVLDEIPQATEATISLLEKRRLFDLDPAGNEAAIQTTGPAITVTPVLTKTEYIALELTKAWMSSYPRAYYGPKDIYGKYRAMINVIEEDSPHES